jgi:hypothetical protein
VHTREARDSRESEDKHGLLGVEDARVNTGHNTGAINWQTRIFRYTRTRTCKYDSKDPRKFLGQRLVVGSSIFMYGGLVS